MKHMTISQQAKWLLWSVVIAGSIWLLYNSVVAEETASQSSERHSGVEAPLPDSVSDELLAQLRETGVEFDTAWGFSSFEVLDETTMGWVALNTLNDQDVFSVYVTGMTFSAENLTAIISEKWGIPQGDCEYEDVTHVYICTSIEAKFTGYVQFSVE